MISKCGKNLKKFIIDHYIFFFFFFTTGMGLKLSTRGLGSLSA